MRKIKTKAHGAKSEGSRRALGRVPRGGSGYNRLRRIVSASSAKASTIPSPFLALTNLTLDCGNWPISSALPGASARSILFTRALYGLPGNRASKLRTSSTMRVTVCGRVTSDTMIAADAPVAVIRFADRVGNWH